MIAPRITIVTVSYNSADVLGDLLTSCPKDVPVIVVDNGSGDNAATRDLAERHGAKMIANTANEGFGRACNRGASIAKTPFILFLNPDAVLGADTLDHLLGTADANPSAVAFNPVLLNSDGTPATKRKSDLIPKSEYVPLDVPDHDAPIYTLNGAAVMVRRGAFEAVGGFDSNIFLFFEDDDLAARLRAKGGALMLSHRALVRHIGGAASSGPKLTTEAFKAWHMGYARLYVLRKHGVRLARVLSLIHI